MRLPSSSRRKNSIRNRLDDKSACRFLIISRVVAISIYLGGLSNAHSDVTDPIGFNMVSCLANSDTYVSIPFSRPPEFSGTVASVSGSTISVNGTPAWTANQFVYAAGPQPKHYYALLGSGGSANPKEGHSYFITANGSNSLTIDTTFDSVTGVTANTSILVIPYWTPATIFPAGDANISFTPTTSSLFYQTQLRVPSASAPGINLPYSPIYFFSNNVDGTTGNIGWRQVGDNTTSHDDDPLLPDGYFVVRNANGAPALPLTAAGAVLMKKLAVPLATSTTQQQDNAVAMVRPINVALNATGLNQVDQSMLPGDQLLLFDNTVAGFDKNPTTSYYFAAGWRASGDPNTDHGNDLIPAGAAMLIRKATTSAGQTVLWLNSPTYTGAPPVQPLQAVSRKSHDSAGNFDINLPLTGTHGIECRSGGGANSYQVVVSFPLPVTYSSVALNQGTVGSVASTSGSGTTGITINLTGVTTGQHLSIMMGAVSDGTNSNAITIPMDVLVGDTSNDGSVNSADISQTKSRSGQSVTASNFRQDVTGDGSLNSADISLVKSKSGTALP